jgi:hypothetical protein
MEEAAEEVAEEDMSKDELNISHISIDLDDSTLVHKFIELQHEDEEESSVDWNDDFDLDATATAGEPPTSSAFSSDDEDWDALLDSDSNTSGTQSISDDLNQVRQLIIADVDTSFNSEDGREIFNWEQDNRRRSTSAEDATLLRSIRRNARHKLQQAQTPRHKRHATNATNATDTTTSFTFSPSLLNTSRTSRTSSSSSSSSRNNSATSINELETQYTALLLEHRIHANNKKYSSTCSSDDSSDDENSTAPSNTGPNTASTTTDVNIDGEITTLERQLASGYLEARDYARSVLFHVKVRDRLVLQGLGDGNTLTELVYVTEVVASNRIYLGEFNAGVQELSNIIRVLVQWITPPTTDAAATATTNIDHTIDYGVSLAVMEHVQCLRFRLGRLHLEAGDESSAVYEWQGLLEVIHQTEVRRPKKRIKLMTVRLWLAETFVRMSALEECGQMLSRIRQADVDYRNEKQGNTTRTTLLTQHSLRSLYEPTSPPSFGTIVIRYNIENGKYRSALSGCEALLLLLATPSHAPPPPTPSSSRRGSGGGGGSGGNRRGSRGSRDEDQIKTVGQIHLLKARALSQLGSMACTTALPCHIAPDWNLVGVSKQDVPDTITPSTTTYSTVDEVVHAASVNYYKARQEYDLQGNMDQSIHCDIDQLETWLDYLYLPVVVHGVVWGDLGIAAGIEESENNGNNGNNENNEENNISNNSNNNQTTTKEKKTNNKAAPPPSAQFGHFIHRKEIAHLLRRCLDRTSHTCRPLTTIRCHLVMAEYSALIQDSSTALSYFKSARDLFVEMYADGVSVPLVRSAPTQYAHSLLVVLRRLVRFLFCSTDCTQKNVLLVDCLLLTEMEYNRKLSAPLSCKTTSSNLFAFHGVDDEAKGKGGGEEKSQDEQAKQRRKSVQQNNNQETTRHIWGLLHRLKMSTEQFSKHQSISMEKMQHKHQCLVQKAHGMMSQERELSRQPTLGSTGYKTLLARELQYNSNRNNRKTRKGKQEEQANTNTAATPTSLLESYRRTMYVVPIGGSAVVCYALNINVFHVVYVGGRAAPYWRTEDATLASFRRVVLNASSRRYLMLLLSTTKQQDHKHPQPQIWHQTAVSWSRFIQSWGQEIAATTVDMCRVAELEEREEGFIPHGRGPYDTCAPPTHAQTGCCLCSPPTTVPHELRSFTRPLAPVVVLVSRSLTMLPFEDILNGGVGQGDDETHRHHVTRALSLLSMASVTWSNRTYLERLHGTTTKHSHQNSRRSSKHSKKRRASATTTGTTTTATTATTTTTTTAAIDFTAKGASANVESNSVRSPQFMCFSYNVKQPRMLRLCERFRQYVCLRTVLNNIHHSTRASRSNSKERWLQHQNHERFSSASPVSLTLQERVRRAGTHTMHLPFQTPVLRHGHSAEKKKKIQSKYPHLNVLHVIPSDVNGGDVVTWVESTIAHQRKLYYPVVLLTLADLCELGEPLLQLLGWIQDCTFVFVPSLIYEQALSLFHLVQKARNICLKEDEKIQSNLVLKKLQIQKGLSKQQDGGGKKKASKRSKKMAHRINQLNALLVKHELPCEWSTSSSTLMSTIALLRQRHANVPIVVLNSPHN